MKKQLFSTLFILSLFITPAVFAAEATPPGCQPIYNGGPICTNSSDLNINKKVLKPEAVVSPNKSIPDDQFIENIGPNDQGYPANTLTAFRIYVTNTTRSTLKNISIKDILPPKYVTFVSGDGKYDDSKRTFSATIKELKSKETKSITIQVLSAHDSDLPEDGSSLCTLNLASATINNKISQDSSQLCVGGNRPQAGKTSFPQLSSSDGTPMTTKGGLPVAAAPVPNLVKSTPPTGPETLALAGLLPLGTLGYILRRKTGKVSSFTN